MAKASNPGPVAAFLSLLLLCACATSADVVPLGEGQWGVEGSLGGPFTKLKSTVIPAPGFVARGTYGVTPSTDVSASLLATPLLFSMLGLDLEMKQFLVKADGWVPAVGVSLGLFALTTLREQVSHEVLAMPLVGTTAAWHLGPGYAYIGGDVLWNTVSFTDFDAAPRQTWSYFFGYRWDWSQKLFLALELKKFVANWRTDDVAADLYSLNETGLTEHHPQNGAWGAMLSAGWRL